MQMSTGPIEFIGEESRDEMPNTEYGGTHGLIQPEFVDGVGAHTELSGAEAARIMVRAGNVPTPLGWQRSGEDWTEGVVRDPRTGRIIDDGSSEDVTGKPGSKTSLSKMADDSRKEDSDHA